MRLGTVTQLAAIHGKAIRIGPGIRLQRPLAAHNGAQVRGSVLRHRPDQLMQCHIPDGSPTAEPDLCGALEAVLEAPEDKKEVELGLTTSNTDEDACPLPPVGLSQRPRLVSTRARRQNSNSDKHIVILDGTNVGPPEWA